MEAADQLLLTPGARRRWTTLMLESVILCSVVFVLLRLLRLVGTNRRKRLPPSPPALPIIGHLHVIARGGVFLHRTLHKLSKTYGPLMYLRIGSVPNVVASSPEMAKEILKTHDLNFSARPRTAAGEAFFYGCSDLLCSSYGPYWKQMRQICVMDLFGAKRTEGFQVVRDEEEAGLVRAVWEDSQQGGEVQVKRKLTNMLNNLICRMVVGRRYSEMDTLVPGTSFDDIISEMSHLLGTFNIGDVLPWLQRFDLQGVVKQMRACAKKSDAVLQGLVDSRRAHYRALRAAGKEPPVKDLLDMLMELQAANKEITDDNMKAVLYDMFAAGTDTSAVAIEWGLTELLLHPQEIKRLQAELDAVVGRERLMAESDVPNLPFLQAVVKETMRLHPSGPLLFPHVAVEDCEVGGYHIPAGTRALVNVFALGRDPSAWPERTLDFWPDRFLGSSVDVKGQHYELLPFGSGRRGCPAKNLGLLTAQMSIGLLLHAFDLAVRPENLDMSEEFGISIVKAVPLAVTATPRLPDSLYRGL